MQTLYQSDSFVVVAFEVPAGPGAGAGALQRGGFEIVDRFTRKEIFIEGAVAESFQQGVQALVAQADSQEAVREAVDAYLAGYAALAQTPVALH